MQGSNHTNTLACASLVLGMAALSVVGAAADRAGPAPPAERPEPLRLTLKADEVIEGSLNGASLRAIGNARIYYQGSSIRADRIEVNRETQVAMASGNIVVEREGQTLTGDELMYDLATGNASLTNARATLTSPSDRGTITAYVWGKELAAEQDIAYIVDGHFSTCGHDPPHYEISAEDWRFKSGEYIQARRAQISLYGVKMPPIGRLRRSLAKGERKPSLLPSIGLSDRDGVYASYGYRFNPKGSPFAAGFDTRASLERGLRGHAFIALEEPGWTLRTTYGVNEEDYEDTVAGFLLDRKPEVYCQGRVLLGPDSGSRTAFTARASWGNYRQFPGRVLSSRTNVEFGLAHSQPFSPTLGVRTSAEWRQSWYDSSQRLGVVTGRLGLVGQFTDDLGVQLVYVRRFDHGSSPFEFDDVDIRRGLLAELNWQVTPNWRVGTELRYDLDRNSIRYSEFEIARLFHCLEYGITYNSTFQDIGFTINIPGL